MINVETLLSFLKNDITANKLGAVVIVERPCDDMRKTNNPYYDKVSKTFRATKRTTYKNVSFRSYEGSVNNRKDKDADYEFEKPKGRHYPAGYYPFIQQSDKDESQYYMVVALNTNTATESTYFVDGKEATPEEIAIIKSFTPAKDFVCHKQVDAGIDPEHAVRIVTPKLQNVISVSFGSKIIKG